MNKKPGLLFSISILALIVLAASFDVHIGAQHVVRLREGIDPATVLYVCPIESSIWDNLSNALVNGRKYVYMFFFFFSMILLFSWGWALYQNLLKDKFSKDVYKNPWGLTKIFFWGFIIFLLLVHTPNHYRYVKIDIKGHTTEWVLCENTSEGARAISAKAIKVR
ncbi:MAG: hypothetical protein MJ156_01635 [Alphaproteobacteria bacterium]|nr:hypothetical protein [Alphaproteobacteria bacterium]